MIPAAEVRVLLAERRREAEQRLAGTAAERAAVVAASRDSNADDEHDPEGATIAYERGMLDVLAQRVRQTLTDVAVAERRLAAGEYQVCERCGGPIADDRLRALPTVRTCRECAGRST
ncbi:TraR/DksA family transcriptional regulator [Cellulomonas taurus]|jgi:DnaK suppressor protein|uniref:TraR/DksA family transcriptional regulator n=1 Tax=Cellulomonas taurus TaxID=2729175 RepID=UPI00145E2DDE|nr:TraR/DksA C4-type zinc finger protein [Cellulomonas taurus]